VNDLIDTTEMYLRTIFELEEEGIVPLRARIAERLHQSGPTVSQTVARMERDGLLTVEGDRHLQLSESGRALATAVMRKHRLAECLLVDVIGLDYADVHEEACRWEHVMSEAVERKLLALLDNPTVSPFGNPIPGLDALGGETSAVLDSLTLLSTTATAEGRRITVRRISEQLQEDAALLRRLADQGVRPGATMVARTVNGTVTLDGVALPPGVAQHVFVAALDEDLTPAEAAAQL
jgi:DtxR family Mn-dependent transcriptional regulator